MEYMIACIGKNRAMGLKGKIPWKLPVDIEQFHQKVSGHTDIMGANTFKAYQTTKPSGNKWIVVTHEPTTVPPPAIAATSIEEALEMSKNDGDIYVEGGGQIFRLAMPYADVIYLTEIDHEYEADTFFPELDPNEWELAESHEGHDDTFEYPFKFNMYRRKRVEQ